MTALRMGHLGLHVRNIEEEMEFLELLGAKMTSMDEIPSRGRIAFVSLDGVWHHNFALFELLNHLREFAARFGQVAEFGHE